MFGYHDSWASIPNGPDPGIEVNERLSPRAQEGHRWRNPVWRHPDGSFAQW